MDKYLWGIAEVPRVVTNGRRPAGAGDRRAYLRRQAGRPGADAHARRPELDRLEEGDSRARTAPGALKWKAAVDATSGRVVADAASGALIDAFYSSSMGGHTEDERYVWGVEAPFLRAVDDSTWDAASSNPAEKRSWATGVTWATLAARLGFTQHQHRVGARRAVRTRGWPASRWWASRTAPSPRRTSMAGTSGRRSACCRRVSRSRCAHTGGPAAQPLVGDWDGDGTDQVGWFRAGQVALQMTGPAAPGSKRFRYGAAGDVAGRRRLGRRRQRRPRRLPGRPLAAADRADRRRRRPRPRLRRPGDRPVVGSWTGTAARLGVVRGRTWLLRRSLTSGSRSEPVPVRPGG